jgi:hypothetical protein
MSAESWPPQLKEWVASCLGQMSELNREEAQAELRQVISDAYSSKTLWTTDWGGVQLKSLLPKPMPIMSTHSLKRKFDPPAGQPKKTKKHQANKSAAAALTLDVGDRAALDKRAQRFRREHELEKQKQNGGGGQASSLRPTQRTAHLFDNPSRSASPFVNADEPEADPNVPNWDQYTIVGTSQEIFKDYLRLTSDPNPEQIRPYHVLQQSLTELKKRWRDKAPYNWICSQFKSLRQDLTVRCVALWWTAYNMIHCLNCRQVQRIKNDFTVAVYEIHARMALEVASGTFSALSHTRMRSLHFAGRHGRV